MAEITYYGHSAFSVTTAGKSILFDPFVSGNPAANIVNIDSLTPHCILLSHGHGDHIGDTIEIYKKTKCQIIAIYEIAEWLIKQGVENVIGMNIGGTVDLGFTKIKMVGAVHSNSLPDGTYAGEAAGFVVYNDEDCFYYAGDTSLTLDMQLISQDFKLGFAFLPVGDHYTMGVSDAARAADFIRCDDIIGMHFDTFPPISIDHEQAIQEFDAQGLNLYLLNINETIEL
jgi:L-ascorbate metabolism protein UlaG (beta-lactamase superfamily)